MGLLQQGENAVSKRNAAREMFCRENAIVLGERWYAKPNAGPPADVLRREKTAASGDCALFCGVNGLLQQSEIAVLRQLGVLRLRSSAGVALRCRLRDAMLALSSCAATYFFCAAKNAASVYCKAQ